LYVYSASAISLSGRTVLDSYVNKIVSNPNKAKMGFHNEIIQ
jgi:hypothetical protein